MAKGKYSWFLDDMGDVDTMRLLDQHQDKIRKCVLMPCEDGEKRNVWRCLNSEFVRWFKMVANRGKCAYHIYVREGEEGPLRRYIFGNGGLSSQLRDKKRMSEKQLFEESSMLIAGN